MLSQWDPVANAFLRISWPILNILDGVQTNKIHHQQNFPFQEASCQ